MIFILTSSVNDPSLQHEDPAPRLGLKKADTRNTVQREPMNRLIHEKEFVSPCNVRQNWNEAIGSSHNQ